MIKDVSFYPDPTYRPPSKPIRIPMSKNSENIDISSKINIDFEESFPFQEGIILETYQRPDKSFFSRTLRIGRSSQYRQVSAKIFY